MLSGGRLPVTSSEHLAPVAPARGSNPTTPRDSYTGSRIARLHQGRNEARRDGIQRHVRRSPEDLRAHEASAAPFVMSPTGA